MACNVHNFHIYNIQNISHDKDSLVYSNSSMRADI